MSNKSNEIELPSLLSFERKLEVLDALMYAGIWSENLAKHNDWKIIPITKRQNRSTMSSHGIEEEKKVKSNPVSSGSDDANLPHDRDTLKISFTLRIIGGVGVPFACNSPGFEKVIREKVDAFKELSLKELAKRYAYNIANGRFLWRNRIGAEKISITVGLKCLEESLQFNTTDFSLNDFNKCDDNPELKTLAETIYEGLASKDDFTLLEVNAYVRLGKGQHVFPSQEMNMNEKRKVLFQLEKCAAMHNVKIGNAIRTIDNWYENEAELPIAIEPFGAVTQRGQAYRKTKNDLYTLMVNWINEEKITDDEKIYIVANLIRGGVFSFKLQKPPKKGQG